MKYRPTQGFTLIELAIVLVIIGLLVGGVLVGRDLIKASELQATVRQFRTADTAAATFRLKYNGIPGDIAASQATSFGLSSRTGTQGQGDGDGLINPGSAGNPARMCCEPILFWTDLSTTQLISDTFTGDGVNGHFINFTSSADFKPYIQHLGMRSNTFMHVVPYNGRNQYYLWKMNTTTAGGTISGGNGLTAYESWQIDLKIDDGMPISGKVVAVTGVGATGPILSVGSGLGSGVCVLNTTTPFIYYTANASWQDNINCQLMVQASF